MDIKQAQKIIREVFEKPFEKERYTNFINNLLNKIEPASFTNQGNYIPDAYKPYISSLERIGKYTDGEHNIDVLIVRLKKETSLERARTMQRNFIARYLNGSRGGNLKDAALVAFVSPDRDDWRFSLVKMDYRFEEGKNGKIKVKEEFTPARRWSFLVGGNEASHTAQSRLVPILADDEHNPVLGELEETFNIETVTKEFFVEYRNLFIRIKEAMDKIIKNDARIKKDFSAKEVDTVNFTKKLLGQIVFLYFLQKKGWFGVQRDEEWGTGSKQFLRNLFEEKHGKYQNFFNDILEPLFYEALRIDRRHDDDYYSRFNCKIPFLNGGLFDPIGNYDWVHTDIIIPNELFSNDIKTKNGDTGNGILDIFDRYNFTVKEDEPLEKDVAIDPELLGKAYEKFNAIRPDNFDEYKAALQSGQKGAESKFNKKFGVYYTPREIVHYMCQQSLINYLATELEGKVKKEEIETLVHFGEQVGENEVAYLVREQNINEGKQKSTTYISKLPGNIRRNAALIDTALANITVCDPAVGSGAFPVGMMHEIVKIRNLLNDVYIKDKNKTVYDFKRDCIENSLYGVDIDAGAVEIAKLRLWLSMIVDEEDFQYIKPLPNLDYKIVCGNSLLGVEVDLFNESFFSELEKLKPQHLNETNPAKKMEYQKKIDDLISQITNGHTEFDFKVYFSEVFHKKEGFDVVIANPPYVQIQKLDEDMKDVLQKQRYQTFSRMADLYCLFYERGINILHTSGVITFISSNKFFRAGYGQSLRQLLNETNQLVRVIDFGELPVFDASTDPCIIFASKNTPEAGKITAAIVKDLNNFQNLHATIDQISFSIERNDLKNTGWALEYSNISKLLEKIRSAGKPLGEYVNGRFYRGILTGLNEAFVIDDATRKQLVKEDNKSAEIIKPWLRGKDIRRWYADFKNLYLIHIPSSSNAKWPWSGKSNDNAEKIFEKNYPAIFNHLVSHKKKLLNRDDQGQYYWELRSCIYHEEFEQPKIVYNETSKELHALYDDTGLCINKTGFIILSDDAKYLLGIMNSKLMDYVYRSEFPSWGDPWQGGRIQFRGDRMETIPIVNASKKQKAKIQNLVNKILHIKKDNPAADVSEYEAHIDQMVYQLYGLTNEEIEIIEGIKIHPRQMMSA